MSKIDTPECDKWAADEDVRKTVTSFLQWLTTQEIELCTFDQYEGCAGQYTPTHQSTDDLLMGWLDIDAKALAKERRAMLKAAR